jgi:hypothetical protein
MKKIEFPEILKPSEGWQPSEGLAIRVYNSIGECMTVANVGAKGRSPLRIDVSNLTAGNYTLRCGNETKMFVKE